jgi:hypothetical protein
MSEQCINSGKLAGLLREFARERDWEQFHSPKNIATSLSLESAELLEHFQWSRGSDGWHELNDGKLRERVEEELADILLYLIRFSDLAGIDLQQCAEEEILKNGVKYPIEQFKGSDRKYND